MIENYSKYNYKIQLYNWKIHKTLKTKINNLKMIK